MDSKGQMPVQTIVVIILILLMVAAILIFVIPNLNRALG